MSTNQHLIQKENVISDEFKYQEIFPLAKDKTQYYLLTRDYISEAEFRGKKILKIEPEGLSVLAEQAFKDVSHYLRSTHLKPLSNIFHDNEASENDKLVALELLKNYIISAQGVFPMCQDTGTAVVIGFKGQQVWTDYVDKEALSKGVFNAYKNCNLRYSQVAPLTTYDEVNTGNNLPAQLEIYNAQGDEYRFLFIAKGAGCSNKTYLYQETRPVFNAGRLTEFIINKLESIGTAACPPYHFVVVIGGLSADHNLKTVKLASAGYLDELPKMGSPYGNAFRDIGLEAEILKASHKLGIGAQFGGKYFCHDIRVLRLPRHGGSCPVGIGLSCSADRQIKAKITHEGIFVEQLEKHPEKYMPENIDIHFDAVTIDLNRPMDEIRKSLSKLPIAKPLLLNGKIVVARDMAHARFKKRLERGEGVPDYLKKHIMYYAGPAKTPRGYPSGSFGPTTGARMDPYVPLLQEHGASLIMLSKGNRSKLVTNSCKKYGGFYLGSIGGEAARMGKECITDIKLVEYPELGMEAVYIITVKDFPAFIIVDDKGNDFFEHVLKIPFAYSVKPYII